MGRLTGGDSAQPYDQRGYNISLSTKTFTEERPRRDKFSSIQEYTHAQSEWAKHALNFQRSDAGREAMRNIRGYSASLQPDGTFAIDEVLPGSYVLSITGDPLKHDPLFLDALDNISREVTVHETTGSDPGALDVGTLDVSIGKQ